MTEFTLYLIQRPDSPYRELLQCALASSGTSVVMGLELREGLGELSSADAMAVLDTARMDRRQRDNSAESLASFGAGVLLVAPKAEHFFEPAINNLNLVGVLVEPVKTAHIRAVFEVARKNHLRLGDLKYRRDVAQRKLEERLVIEQAVDRLMADRGLMEAQAMRCLQQNARRNNKSVARVARAYLEHPDSLPNGCL